MADADFIFETQKPSLPVKPISQRHMKTRSGKKAANKNMTPASRTASRTKGSRQPSPKESVHFSSQSSSKILDDQSKQDYSQTWSIQQRTSGKIKVASLPRESHAACSGPEFSWHFFNIYGHSPLIQQFLQNRHAEPKAGYDFFMPRREISKPIPDSAETYADLIKQAFKKLNWRHKTFTRTYRKNWKEMRNFDQQLLESHELFRKELKEEMHRRMVQKKQERLPICSDRTKNSEKI